MEWLNENQGVVAAAVFVLGGIGFLVRKFFFSDAGNKIVQKQKSGDNSVNIQSGRDTNYGGK